MIGTPRIQARVGEIEDPPELKGKWTFEIILSILGTDMRESFQCRKSFDTKEEAHQEMELEVQKITKIASEGVGSDPEKYVDLKTGQLRNWKEPLQ
jgi:hypothetical protein